MNNKSKVYCEVDSYPLLCNYNCTVNELLKVIKHKISTGVYNAYQAKSKYFPDDFSHIVSENDNIAPISGKMMEKKQ